MTANIVRGGLLTLIGLSIGFICNAQFELPSTFKIISKGQENFDGDLRAGDLFGISVASMGDFDNDGIEDIVVGASSTDDGGAQSGAIWIVLLNRDNSVKNQYKISNAQGGLAATIPSDSRFGYSVANIGDLNGDGTTDVAVGAVYDHDGGYQHGAVWIIFLDEDGTVKTHQKINETAGGFTGSLADLASFGSSVTTLGDVDGDGVIDLAVGAYRDNGMNTKTGAVYLLLMNPDGSVKSNRKISGGNSGFPNVLGYEDYFGCSVANAGDSDGDGIAELIVGSQRDDDAGPDAGAIWILFLHGDGTVKNQKKITKNQSGFNYELNSGELFGTSISVVANINEQGDYGFLVGSTRDNAGGADAGAVWTFETERNFDVTKAGKLSYTLGGSNIDIKPGSRFGQSVLVYPSGSGYNFVIGAPYYDELGQDLGALWVLGTEDCGIEITDVSAGVDQAVCGYSATLSASLGDGEEGFWTALGPGVFEDIGDPNTVVANMQTGLNTFVWTVSNSCGQKSDTVTVFVSDSLEGVSAGDDFNYCASSLPVSLNAVDVGGGGVWASEHVGVSFFDKSSPQTEVNFDSPGVYNLIWTVSVGQCTASDTVTITIQEQSLAYAGEDIDHCFAEAAQLHAQSPVAGIGRWEVIEGNVHVFSPESSSSGIEADAPGLSRLIWTVSGGICPASVDTVLVNFYSPRDLLADEVPNAFSPNGDSRNDRLEILSDRGLLGSQLDIFSRDGQMIHHAYNYQNDWDGDHFPSGIYYYTIKFIACPASYRGYFHLVR
ncbi:MAG: gliding motility-associated C-terminal domain-containing protein [Imperialibacter sp.]|uniref:T9SS type B sorting domain-containing protein n=1 Tax=Imperialibacter sp. TaxID=2038411 RepID=UPI0030D9E4E6|tara:strand:- start:65326 stop:67650 length:2325 start_codon:yes stop_codon:yes gene_type:complete